ncbi:MarR family transcriptional regulator [Nonomuraea sp. NPDC049309]|uniref:MarR family transcriptional regulator n=1 Tax=Nonomuraea sp. NPDC049309 TaxID=3364350 RepID=UPI00371AFB58
MLLLDGPLTVSQLADRPSVAPTTVSLLVSELSRKGVLERREDDADRRRRIIDISPGSRPAISRWPSPGARAWRRALEPLTAEQRRLVVDTLLAYESALAETRKPPRSSGGVRRGSRRVTGRGRSPRLAPPPGVQPIRPYDGNSLTRAGPPYGPSRRMRHSGTFTEPINTLSDTTQGLTVPLSETHHSSEKPPSNSP